MRSLIYAMLAVLGMASIADAAPLSEAELKNLFASIRQHRTIGQIFGYCVEPITRPPLLLR